MNAEYVGELADGEFRSFLHFVSTEESTSSFTNEIAAAMDELNRSEEGRSLMTLEMKLREERRIAKEAGIEMGREEGREEVVLSMLDAGDVSMELACKWLNLSEEEVAKRRRFGAAQCRKRRAAAAQKREATGGWVRLHLLSASLCGIQKRTPKGAKGGLLWFTEQAEPARRRFRMTS